CSQVLTGARRDAGAHRLVAAVAFDGLDAGLDPGRLLGLGVDHHHVGHVDGGLLDLDAAGVDAALTTGTGVLGDAVDALDQDPVGLGVDGDDAALQALVLAGDDLDEVVLLDLHLGHGLRSPPARARRSS